VFPPKETVTVTVPATWFTDSMAHDAEPDESVVAVQLCTDFPVPSVSVTGWLLSGVPLLDSVVDRVSDWPLVTDVAPV
jgi:hypothetical protein